MRTSLRSALAGAVVLLPFAAAAEKLTFKVEKTDSGFRCGPPATEGAKGSLAVGIEIGHPGELAPALQVQSGVEGSAAFTTLTRLPASTGERSLYQILRASLGGKAGSVRILGPQGKPLCDETRIPAAAEAAAGGAGDAGEGDAGPEAWWQESGQASLDELQQGNRGYARTRFLVHYPSGEPAPPFPTSISEAEKAQVVIVAKAGAVPDDLALSVTQCEGLQPFRIKQPPAGAPQALVAAPYRLVAYGLPMACGAGSLSYSLKIGGQERVHTVRVRPVYRLAATAAYGFDFVEVPSYGAAGGKITEDRDRAGFGLRLGFTWFPGGVDYEDMKWWNYVNPVFAVDPGAPTESFLLGLAATPTGGFAVLVGAGFRKVRVLRGAAVGDAFIGPGDVPTDKVWRRRGIGLFLGISVDQDVFQAIRGRIGA